MSSNIFNDKKYLIICLLFYIFIGNGILYILYDICRNSIVFIGIILVMLYPIICKNRSLWNIIFFEFGIVLMILGYLFKNVIVIGVAGAFLISSADDRIY